jgi:hypothetical protein
MRRLILVSFCFGVAVFGAFGAWRARQARQPVVTELTDPISEAELEPEKQKYVWDTEHTTFEIETRFGKPFIAALRDNDESRLQQFFANQCEASSLDALVHHNRKHGLVEETRRSNKTAKPRPADVGAIVSGLLRQLAGIDVKSARQRVLKIEALDDGQQHWKIEQLLTATGATAEGELFFFESTQDVELRFADDAADEDHIIWAWHVTSETTRRSSRELLEEVTETVGLDEIALPDNWTLPSEKTTQYRFQMAVADFDQDGWFDIAVATNEGIPFLLQAAGDHRYRDVAPSMGIRSWEDEEKLITNLAAWIDYDNDGFPDLLMGNRLYHNQTGEKFEDVTEASGIVVRLMPMGAAVADYDCDGDLDLYICYQESFESDPYRAKGWVGDNFSGMQNELWRNEGDGKFVNVTSESNAGGGRGHTFTACWFFYDDDHYPDLYLANDFGNNVLLRNRGDGSFDDISRDCGASDFATSMGAATGDLDNDGVPEIYVANMFSKMGRRIIAHLSAEDYPAGIYDQIVGSCAGNRLYHRQHDQRYREISMELGVNRVGWAYAPAIVDLDGDGWLDIYATTGFMSFNRKKPDG